MSLEKQWRSLESPHPVYKTPVGDVLSEKFRCERTGVVHDFISFRLSDWVLAVPETPDGNLLMLRQFRHGSHHVEWEFPGGCVDAADRSPEEAAARELREETGCAGDCSRVLGSFCPNPALQSNRCWIVLITNVRKVCAPMLDETEVVEPVIRTGADLAELFERKELDHGIMLNAVLFYFAAKHKLQGITLQ